MVFQSSLHMFPLVYFCIDIIVDMCMGINDDDDDDDDDDNDDDDTL